MARAILRPIEPGHRRVLALAWPALIGNRWLLLRILALSMGASLMVLIQPYLSKVLIDQGAMAGNLRVLVASCALMLLTPLFGVFLESFNRFAHIDLSSQVLFRLRERVFGHLQDLPPAYYARTGLGELFSRFDTDLAQIQRLVVDSPLAVVGGIFNLALLTVLMGSLSTPLALLVLAVVPLQVAAAWIKRGDIENASREVRVRSAALSGYFLDSLRAVKFIQASNTQSARLDGLRDHHRAYYQSLRASQRAGFALSLLQRLAGTLGMAIVVGVGGWLLMQHQTTVGVLVAFVSYAARASGPVNTLLGVFAGWQRARISLTRVAELMDSAPLRPAQAANPSVPGICRGEVEFRGVDYRHDADVWVLRDASFRIAAGSKTLLLGASGGGKSTLADLLLCHCLPQAGAILLDGIDIADIDLGALRRSVSVVEQEPVFFPGTVADNLRYVAPGAGDEEIRAAMAAAGLDLERVAPDRQLGAASFALSRGERMRLALARAILQQPAVLVLDETTSSVDRTLALSIMGCVDRIFAGKTRIVISHDPLLAGAVDQVCVLRCGQVSTDSAELDDAA